MHCIVGLSKVSELRTGEGNNGNSSSLESSGTGNLVVFVTELGAFAPLCSVLVFCLTLTFVTIIDLNINSSLSIAGGDHSKGVSINFLGSRFDDDLLGFDGSNSFIISSVTSQEFHEVWLLRRINVLVQEVIVGLLGLNLCLEGIDIGILSKFLGFRVNLLLLSIDSSLILFFLWLVLKIPQGSVFSDVFINSGGSGCVSFLVFGDNLLSCNVLKVSILDSWVTLLEDLISWSLLVVGILDINVLVSSEFG